MKRAGAYVALLAIFLIMSAPAAGQYVGPAVVSVSDATLSCPGDDFTLTGEGFDPNTEVSITFDGDQLASVTTDSDGNFSATITAPEAAAGSHTVTASGGGESASATVTCVAEGAVAFTGRDISMGLILLAGLIVAGGTALALGRRRAARSA
jgi:hypothetical protein